MDPGWTCHLKDTQTLVRLSMPEEAECSLRDEGAPYGYLDSQRPAGTRIMSCNKPCRHGVVVAGTTCAGLSGTCTCPAVNGQDSRPASAWDLRSSTVSCYCCKATSLGLSVSPENLELQGSQAAHLG